MLPRPQVLALRKRIAGALHDLRWINALQPSPHANGDGDAEDYAGTLVSTPPVETFGVDPHDWPIFDRVQLMEEFHALPHAHALLSTLTHVMGERVLMHPRHICRVHFPNQDENRTLPHQDYPYVQGSNRFVTNWCPLGDVPASMGPLAILVGSHHYGMRSLVRSNNGQMMVDVAELLPRCWWGTTDFRAGDVLTFSAFTVHMGLDNTSDQVRLSLDCRAQPLSEQVSARALTPNWDRQSWDYIYSKWQDHDSAAEHRNGSDGAKSGFGREAQVETLKFYWERLPLNIAQVGIV